MRSQNGGMKMMEKTGSLIQGMFKLMSLGIGFRQWAASVSICALLMPVFWVPVQASVVDGNGRAENYLQFEPVNPPLPIWERAKNGFELTMENWLAKTPEPVVYKVGETASEDKNIFEGDEKKHIADKPEEKAVKKEILKTKESFGNENVKDNKIVEKKNNKAKNADSVSTPEIKSNPDGKNNNNAITLTPAIALSGGDPAIEEDYVESLSIPQNILGTPAGQTEMSSMMEASAVGTKERAGSSNYSFSLPVAALPGRGLDAAVGITYNSRLWHRWAALGSDIFTYNNDKNWLAPGFLIGFGHLDRYVQQGSGSGYKYSLTSANGTRIDLIHKSYSGGISVYESTNGTLMQTSIAGSAEDTAPTMEIKLPDGSKILYGAKKSVGQTYNQGRRYPIQITDRNGNTITISYISGDTEGKIASIRDTLGRYINFHYDTTTDKKLVAVTVPGYNGVAAERQTIRFYYDTLTFQNCFPNTNNPNCFDTGNPNGTVFDAPSTITVLKYIYYPGTQTGYKYYYSPFVGSIYKIEQYRAMQVSPAGLTTTGTVNAEGTWAAATSYNYPSAASELNGHFDDAPEYTERTDDWRGRTSAAALTQFDVTEQTDSRTTTITNPDGTKSVSIAKNASGAFDSGLIQETKIIAADANGLDKVWAKTKMYWIEATTQTQGRSKTRLDKIEVTNDAGQTKATSFGYDVYNNPTLAVEYGFAAAGQTGTELRRTETTYQTDSNYTNNHLFRLPLEVKTKVNNVYVSKVKYEYDGGSLIPRTFPVSGTHTGVSSYRGNVTKITAFSDAALASDPNASTTTRVYDVAGNVTQASLNCCQSKTWTYDQSSNFAYPISETKGDAGQLTTSFAYDLNTGLLKSLTDANNQQTAFTYDANNLRLTRTDAANGAWATTEYNDSVYPFYVKRTSSLDATRSVSGWSYSDGRGQGYRTRSQTANGYISSDVEFDVIGRVKKSYKPYTVANLLDARPGTIDYTEITERDALSRTLEVTLPDATTVQTAYNGLITTVTDQAGKQRRQTADALGRVARVDEPDANGVLGNQPTFYEYDGNNNLSKVTQTEGGITQTREFKYDSLSRLTHEKQVEATPTLDENGLPTGNKWTGYYKYNLYGLLEKSVDARGATKNFIYDGLNRIKTITYSGESGYQTPQVTYTYDESRNDTGGVPYSNNGRLTTVKTAEVSSANQTTPETIHYYDYNKVGQMVSHTQSIGNQSYKLEYGYNLAGQLTSEKYPSGRTVNTTIDDFGSLQTVADSQTTYLTGVSFNNEGLVSSKTLGNGTNEAFTYNERLQMTSQSLMKGTEVIQKYAYSYGQVNLDNGIVDATKNNGQLGKIESFIGTSEQWSQRFAYDELGRLAEAREYKQDDNNQLTYKQKFDFDRFGNLYRKAASNPTTGQQNPLPFTAIEDGDISKQTNQFTTNTTYDDAGQVLTDNKFRQMSFAYDGNGRRIKATSTYQDASTVYDALGNRVATRSYDTWQFAIYDAFGKLIAEYGIETQGLGGVKYVQQDRQGSPRVITNDNGFVVARNDYTAFGEEIGSSVGLRSGDQGYAAEEATKQSYGLTETDKATGQQHAWARKLETQAGRWTSPDPYKGSMSIGDPQSFNRYAYVRGDPVNFIDPSGLEDVPPPPPFPDDGDPIIIYTWTFNPMQALWELYLGGLNHSLVMPVMNREHNNVGGGTGGDDPLPFNSCAEFVTYLMGYASLMSHVYNKAQRAEAIGAGMMHTAYYGYNRHINNGFKGFKEKLIGKGEGQQGAGVYGHILFHAGAYLNDVTMLVSTAAHVYDLGQDIFGHDQGDEEIAGNHAGTAVGKLLWGQIKSGSDTPRDREALEKNLRAELCE